MATAQMRNDPEWIAYNLINFGPVSAGVSAGNECWQFYSGGILTSESGCPVDIDHSAAVVGIDRTGD